LNVSDQNSRVFPSTIWSNVGKAKLDGTEDGVAAMNEFIATYWRPVYHFLRAKGYSDDRAEELTQEFMYQLMQRDWLRRADPDRGRLRSFILKVLVRFLADQGASRVSRQRQFELQLLPVSTLVSEQDRTIEPACDQPPEAVFDRQWATSVIAGVLELLKLSFAAQDRIAWYELFCKEFRLESGEKESTQDELAAEFGVTRDKVRYAQEQARSRFEQLLRVEVRCQVPQAEDVDREMREILRLANVAW
jgi:RNA polymerase sigma-70 factor (ECF subfamily)